MSPSFAKIGYPCPPRFNPADYVMFLAQTEDYEKIAIPVETSPVPRGATPRTNTGKNVKIKPRGTSSFTALVTAAPTEAEIGSEIEMNPSSPGYIAVKDDEGGSRRSAASVGSPVVYETESKDNDSRRSVSLPELQKEQFGLRSSFTTQLHYLCEREARGVWRNQLGLVFKFLTAGLLNLLFALIFLGAGGRDETGPDAQLNLGTHFGAVTQLAVSACFSATQPISLTFPLERPVFLREYATGTYSALPYMLSKLMVELPITFLQQCVVFLVAYWIMDLQGNWFYLVLSQTLLCIATASSALAVGCAVSDAQNVSQLVPLVVVPQILFTGFFIRISQIPVWLRWAQYLCSLKFALNLILLIEFGDCPDQQTCDDFVLDPNSVVENDWWIYMMILFGIFAGFRFFALYLLVSKAKNFA
jgi:hypothetical protein